MPLSPGTYKKISKLDNIFCFGFVLFFAISGDAGDLTFSLEEFEF